MLTKLLAILRNTFTETIRQPVFGLLVMVIMGCLTVNTMTAAFTTSPSEEIYDDDKMMYDLGLSTLLIGGLFLAGFSSAGVLSREIENKTVLTVISKPVSRPIFVVGKFLGLAGALTVGFYLCALTFLLNVRHGVMQASSQHFDWPVILFGLGAVFLAFAVATFCNYFYGWQFTSSCLALGLILLTLATILVGFINDEWQLQSFAKKIVETQITTAIVLVYFAVMVLTAVALAASTRLGQVMTLLICFLVLGLGLTSDYFFQPYAYPEYKPLPTSMPSAADDPRLRDPNLPSEAVAKFDANNPPTPAEQAETARAWQEESETPAETPPPKLVHVASRRTARILARIVYAVIPNMQFFWVSDAIILRRPIPAQHVLKVFGYAFFYIVALVLLAVALFQAREVAADESASTAPAVVHLLAVVGRVFAALQVAAGIWWALTEAVKPGEATIYRMLLFAAVGVFLWFFWGWFARGMKWTWYGAILLVGVFPVAVMIYVLIAKPILFSPLFAMPGVTAILVLTILSPTNRAHFGFGKEPKRRRRRKAPQPDAS
ncbi:MAG: ABC transporter permease subunit [Phycisphaerae bacterium]|nr:ABC transporter permease subunit [Phycisphaerae bacterium]